MASRQTKKPTTRRKKKGASSAGGDNVAVLRPYGVKPGARIKASDAAVLGPLIEKLADAGTLSPRSLWNAAAEESHPAHYLFEWDDSVAAKKHRDSQASYYLRSVVVLERTIHQDPIRVAMPTRVEPHRYDRATRLMEDDRWLRGELARAKQALIAWRNRYDQLRDIADLKGVFEAIDEVG